MSELKIIKASAGSGKTYRLTLEYLHLLYSNYTKFNQILAVTFTNKATGEMKGRIIKELYNLSTNANVAIANEIKNVHKISDSEVKDRAARYLTQILHNYSGFSVSTIDSFFQNVIKSFAREAGLSVNYEMELNSSDIIEKATDQLLIKIDEKPQLQKWLVSFAEERILEGKSWVFRKEIETLAKELFNEEFQLMGQNFIDKLGSYEYLYKLQAELNKIKYNFEQQLNKFGTQAIDILNNNEVFVTDFYYKDRGPAAFLVSLAQAEPPDKINSYVNKVIADSSLWVSGKATNKKFLEQVATNMLHPLLLQATEFYNTNLCLYLSATEVLSRFYALGLLVELTGEIREYVRDNNIFILAESGRLLKALIDNNDTPFIYERSGRIFKHFMIDEFQDTSKIQWANFLPLIKNSLAENNANLIVGDIKQSIYRWRNSDWKIMAHQAATNLHGFKMNQYPLEYNWRSSENVILFNNSVFSIAPQIFQDILNQKLSETSKFDDNNNSLNAIITNIYKQSAQIVPQKNKAGGGYVKLAFINTSNETETDINSDTDDMIEVADDLILFELQSIINKLQDNNHFLNDIAILVRTKGEGKTVADYLNKLNAERSSDSKYKYDVISNEAIFVNRAPAVQLIMAVIAILYNPSDDINRALIKYLLLNLNIPNPLNSEQLNINELLIDWQNYNITHLVSEIMQLFKLNTIESQLPYLQSFTDAVFEYGQNNPSNLNLFINWWDKHGINKTVSLSDNQEAIKILTIHKSKGLEFKNVIIPYCNWNYDHVGQLSPLLWCQTNVEPFNMLGFVPVKYKSNLAKTIFNAQYFNEKAHAFIDALNLMYVAFTRAATNLFVLCPYSDSKNSNNVATILKMCFENDANVSDNCIPLKQYWNSENLIFEIGKIAVANNTSKIQQTINLENIAIEPLRLRLRQKYASTQFDSDGEQIQVQLPAEEGIVMHKLFQFIKTEADIPIAVNKMVNEGLLSIEKATEIEDKIRNYITVEPYNNWFSNNWDIKTETDIILPNGLTIRPDRVLINGNQAIVIDYKFGKQPKNAHKTQIQTYMQHLSNMGYTHIEGYVWYVILQIIEKV